MIAALIAIAALPHGYTVWGPDPSEDAAVWALFTPVPTPTPTESPPEAPTVAQSGPEAASAVETPNVFPPSPLAPSTCPTVISSALGWAGCAISFCESGWDPSSTGAEGERGYFQVHPRWHYDSTYDPAGNVAAAVRISSGGSDWSAWTTRSVLYSGICPNGRIVPS